MASDLRCDAGSLTPRWLLSSLAIIGIFFLQASLAWAQISFGSMTGVVTDPTGAVVPKASVVLTDVNKGYTYPATTDATGRYLIVNLIPSTYRIKVETPGFKTYVQGGIVVEVGTPVGLDVHLVIGTASQTVEVTGTAPLLSTQTSVTGQEISRSMINDLPLVDRNVLDLAFLSPGRGSSARRRLWHRHEHQLRL